MTETTSSRAVAASQSPAQAFSILLNEREAQFKAGLPAHIPVERFKRVVLTAVQRNPALLKASQVSLYNASMQAAQDGLLPDGREGALVIYKTKQRDGGWVEAVQWMPMISGILKKVRNSGDLASIVARVVYAGDKFRNWIDDSGEHIEYEASDDADTSMIRCVFAMAKLKDGSIEVEVLRPSDIEKIRNVSRSKDRGPWVDWWDEMAKKSALRRLSKRLPISTDLDDLIRRDDALYDMDGSGDKAVKPAGVARDLGSRLDALAGPAPAAQQIKHDAETGEILENDVANRQAEAPVTSQPPVAEQPATNTAAGGDDFPGDTVRDWGSEESVKIAHAEGREACVNGDGRSAMNADYSKDGAERERKAWTDGWREADAEANQSGGE